MESNAEETPMEDARIAPMEKERSAPFTEEQRRRLPARLKEIDDGSAERRTFPLSDGGSEPCSVFQPVRADRKSNRRQPVPSKDGS
jgi:hypothetical protein